MSGVDGDVSLLIHHRAREAAKATGKSLRPLFVLPFRIPVFQLHLLPHIYLKYQEETDVFPSAGFYGCQIEGSGLCSQLWPGFKFGFHLREETHNGKVDTLFTFPLVCSAPLLIRSMCDGDFWSF